jgi:hypothetical protein
MNFMYQGVEQPDGIRYLPRSWLFNQAARVSGIPLMGIVPENLDTRRGDFLRGSSQDCAGMRD